MGSKEPQSLKSKQKVPPAHKKFHADKAFLLSHWVTEGYRGGRDTVEAMSITHRWFQPKGPASFLGRDVQFLKENHRQLEWPPNTSWEIWPHRYLICRCVFMATAFLPAPGSLPGKMMVILTVSQSSRLVRVSVAILRSMTVMLPFL